MNRLVGSSVIRSSDAHNAKVAPLSGSTKFKRFMATALITGTLSCGGSQLSEPECIPIGDAGITDASGDGGSINYCKPMAAKDASTGEVAMPTQMDAAAPVVDASPAVDAGSNKCATIRDWAYVLHVGDQFLSVKEGDKIKLSIGNKEVTFTVKTENKPYLVSEGEVTIKVNGMDVTGVAKVDVKGNSISVGMASRPTRDVLGVNVDVSQEGKVDVVGAQSQASLKVTYTDASGVSKTETITLAEKGDAVVLKTRSGEVAIMLAQSADGGVWIVASKDSGKQKDSFAVSSSGTVDVFGVSTSVLTASDNRSDRYSRKASFEVITTTLTGRETSTPTVSEGDTIACAGGVSEAKVLNVVGTSGTNKVGTSQLSFRNGTVQSLEVGGQAYEVSSGPSKCSFKMTGVEVADVCNVPKGDAGETEAGGSGTGGSGGTTVNCTVPGACPITPGGPTTVNGAGPRVDGGVPSDSATADAGVDAVSGDARDSGSD